MDYNSVLLILSLVSRGVGVVKEISDLAKRVENGDTITDDEIKKAQIEVDEAVARWKMR